MRFGSDESVEGSQYGGLACVIILHVIIVYILIYDATRTAVAAMQTPIQIKIVDRVKPPPPPELPPPPPNKVKLPPPPFIPPPEVTLVQQPVEPTITRTVLPEPPPPMTERMVPIAAIEADDPRGIVKGSMLIRNGCELLEYPWTEQRDRHEGPVFLSFLVDPEGRVMEGKIDKSSGYKKLDEAALSGISVCRFKPTLIDGVPRVAWKKLEFVWSMGSY